MRFVKDVIFFIVEPNTAKTCAASNAMDEELRVRTIIAIPRERETVALDTIDTLVAPFATVHVEAVVTILRLPDDMPVRTVLILHVAEY